VRLWSVVVAAVSVALAAAGGGVVDRAGTGAGGAPAAPQPSASKGVAAADPTIVRATLLRIDGISNLIHAVRGQAPALGPPSVAQNARVEISWRGFGVG
jgi:hypothetical protein